MVPGRIVWKDHEAMSAAAAHYFIITCQQSIARQGKFSVALSGGSTPKRMFEILAKPEYSRNIAWKKVFLFWSDERFVPYESPDSNYNLAYKSLIDRIEIPVKNVFPVPITGNPESAAKQYEASIRKHFNGKPPVFDLIMLGTGRDGHTASLFPNTPVLIENRKLIKHVWLQEQQSWRITFTFPLINKAKHIAVLASGREKMHVVSAVFMSKGKKIYPVQYINPDHSLWIVDEEAVGK